MFVKMTAFDQAGRESRISINTDQILVIQPFGDIGIVPRKCIITMSTKDVMLMVQGSVEEIEKTCNTGTSSLSH